MGRNQQVGEKTEGRDNHVEKGNEDQWKSLTPGFHVPGAALSPLFRHYYGPHGHLFFRNSRCSKNHQKEKKERAGPLIEKAGQADSSGGVREQGKVTRREGSGPV